MRKFAVSDIHGCFKTFKKLMEEVVRFSRDDELYIVGDFVDRGPNTKALLDYVMRLIDEGYHIRCLMGNHEYMMLESRRQGKATSVWRLNGGVATMESFRASSIMAIPQAYFDFMSQFEDYITVDEFILVHAGLNFSPKPQKVKKDFLWKVKNPFQDRKSLLWLRDWHDNLDRIWLGDRIIVHGHTPMSAFDIQYMVHDLEELPVIDIDNGCYAKFNQGMGSLCALEMTQRKLFFQKNID